MTKNMNRRNLLLGATLGVIGGSSRASASDPPIPADARRRLGTLLATNPFENKGCLSYLAVSGENIELKLEFVNEVGDLIAGMVHGIWQDDPAFVASESRGKGVHQLLSKQELICYRMLWASSELVAMARGWKVDSKAPLDVGQLREAVAYLALWTGDVRLRTTIASLIDRFYPPPPPVASSGGGGNGPPTTPPPVATDDLPPGEDGVPLPTPHFARCMDLFHITGIEFIFLMKILADLKEKDKEARIRRFREAFSVQLTKELGRPVAPAEAAYARRSWAERDVALPLIAHGFSQ